MEDFRQVKELLVNELGVDPENFTRDKFAAAVEYFGRYYLVAKVGERVVGFVSGFDDGVGLFHGYMGRLVVDKEFRNNGIGRELVERCLGGFKDAGVNSVIVGVRRDNVASRRIFEGKIGFNGGDYFLLYKSLREQ